MVWDWLLLSTGVLLASSPFLFHFKSSSLRIISFILAYGLFLLLGWWIEGHLGQNAEQEWAFYAITFLLFIVAGFPAFAWRYLWHQSTNA